MIKSTPPAPRQLPCTGSAAGTATSFVLCIKDMQPQLYSAGARHTTGATRCSLPYRRVLSTLSPSFGTAAQEGNVFAALEKQAIGDTLATSCAVYMDCTAMASGKL